MNASRPGALLVTRDGDLLHAVVRASADLDVPPPEIRFDVHAAAETVRSGSFSVVVIDDEVMTESDRAWLIDEIHRCLPGCSLVYVAPRGSSAIESTVRLHGVDEYVEKPIHVERLSPAMHSSRCESRKT